MGRDGGKRVPWNDKSSLKLRTSDIAGDPCDFQRGGKELAAIDQVSKAFIYDKNGAVWDWGFGGDRI